MSHTDIVNTKTLLEVAKLFEMNHNGCIISVVIRVESFDYIIFYYQHMLTSTNANIWTEYVLAQADKRCLIFPDFKRSSYWQKLYVFKRQYMSKNMWFSSIHLLISLRIVDHDATIGIQQSLHRMRLGFIHLIFHICFIGRFAKANTRI